MQTEIRADRLLKLAAFLDKLPGKKFDFSVIARRKPRCATVGCAIGWMPNVWPEKFKRRKCLWGVMRVVDRDNVDVFDTSGHIFFGIDYYDFCALFSPYQDTSFFGGKDLDGDATPAAVAANIRAFVEHFA